MNKILKKIKNHFSLNSDTDHFYPVEGYGLSDVSTLKLFAIQAQNLSANNSPPLQQIYSNLAHNFDLIRGVLLDPNLCTRCLFRDKDLGYDENGARFCEVGGMFVAISAGCVHLAPIEGTKEKVDE